MNLTPGKALAGTSAPLMPSITSKSKSVREAANLMASSLSVRSGMLMTKTFSNYEYEVQLSGKSKLLTAHTPNVVFLGSFKFSEERAR